jgi:hypothetical protein
MLPARLPGRRLITQNLLISAAGFERAPQIDASALSDLSILIDLFCLYDRAIVLSRESWLPLRESNSELMDLLNQHEFIEIDEPASKDIEAITTTAKKHLTAFLGGSDVQDYDGLLRYALSPDEAWYGIHYRADGVEALQLGREWLIHGWGREDLMRRLAREADVARGTTFLVRSFLYLAYADIARLPFTPDAARCPALATLLDGEDELLREAFLDKFKSTWEQHPTSGYRQLRRNVSPFAGLVFERSKDRSDVARQMEQLRKELAPFRKRVGSLEDTALWGSRDEAVAAERKWEGVLTELATNFGADPRLVSIRRALAFGESVSAGVAEPTSWKDWLSSLAGLPLEIASRLVSQRPAVEIHHLRGELPGPGRLAAAVERLFGPVRQES